MDGKEVNVKGGNLNEKLLKKSESNKPKEDKYAREIKNEW